MWLLVQFLPWWDFQQWSALLWQLPVCSLVPLHAVFLTELYETARLNTEKNLSWFQKTFLKNWIFWFIFPFNSHKNITSAYVISAKWEMNDHTVSYPTPSTQRESNGKHNIRLNNCLTHSQQPQQSCAWNLHLLQLQDIDVSCTINDGEVSHAQLLDDSLTEFTEDFSVLMITSLQADARQL